MISNLELRCHNFSENARFLKKLLIYEKLLLLTKKCYYVIDWF